jgi:hypothetical protein
VKKNSSDTIPSFQFYPNDWLGDMNLRMCSVATRGVWIDLLCIMHKSKKYGYLVQKESGKWSNMSPKTIQKLTGMTRKRIVNGLRELSKNDVIKYDDNGLMYSKRLVKDHRLRKIRMEVGKLGGNPNLVNQSDNQKSTPSSSSSPSSSYSGKNTPISPKPKKKETIISSKEVDAFFRLWNKYAVNGVKRANKLTNTRIKQIKSRLKEEPNLDYWQSIFSKLQRLPFYCGENKNGWQVNIDYIIRNDTNHVKIYEIDENFRPGEDDLDRIYREMHKDD